MVRDLPKFLRAFVRDLATLKLPVTAAAATATLVALVAPFGLDLGPHAAAVTGALVGVGTLAAYVQHLKAG